MVKKYNEIEAKNNMQVEEEVEEVVEKQEKKQLQKIVQVQPTKVKKSLIGRLITGIMGPEGLPGIGAYVNEEIIKPAVKNIIYDSITSGLGRALNMDYRQNRGGHTNYNRVSQPHRNRTQYSNKYNNSHPEPEERRARPARYGVDEYVIEDRNDAAEVLITLTENADRYDVTSVADYYELIGVASQHTDHNYGWTIDSITKATILRVQGGYIIKFPPVEVI